MTNKLHTSLKTQEIFSSLGQSLNLQPFILSKLAIALSIRKGDLTPQDFETDNNGLELSRQVIFGDHDLLFRSLIVKNEGRVVREDDYFPDLVILREMPMWHFIIQYIVVVHMIDHHINILVL